MVRFNPDWFQMQEDAYLDKINQNEIMMAESSRNSHTTPLCCSQEKIMVASSFQWCGGSPPSLSLARFLLSLYLSSSWISLVFFFGFGFIFWDHMHAVLLCGRACPPLEAGALLLLLPGGINGTPLPLPAHVRQNLTSPES